MTQAAAVAAVLPPSTDLVARFLDACILREPGAYVGVARLHDVFVVWCERHAAAPIGPFAFAAALARLRYDVSLRHGVVKVVEGVAVSWDPFPAGPRHLVVPQELRPEDVMMLGRIANERAGQISREGYRQEHDDQHDGGALAGAASAYALSSVAHGLGGVARRAVLLLSRIIWPWGREWWKPKDPLRDIERAGALLVADGARRLRNREG